MSHDEPVSILVQEDMAGMVPGIIAITEHRVSEVFLGSLRVYGYNVSLENHRGFQACVEKLFGLAESMWALKPFGLHQG